MGAAPKLDLSKNKPLNPESISVEAQWFDRLQDIPTLPAVAMKVSELLQKPKSSTEEVSLLLKGDPVLTAKILRLANSSFYSIPGGVSDVTKALSFIGYNTIAQLALGLSVFTTFKDIEGGEFSMNDFWKHSLSVAFLAEALAKLDRLHFQDHAFTCGLLHDIGKLAYYKLDRELFLDLVKTAKTSSRSFCEIETERGLPSHTVLGGQLAKRWKLPENIRFAIEYHHGSEQNGVGHAPLSDDVQKLIEAIQWANRIANSFRMGESGNYKVTKDIPKDLIQKIEPEFKNVHQKVGAFINAVR